MKTTIPYILLFFSILLSGHTLFGQNEDSTIYRTNGVKKEVTRLFLPLFEKRRDTCFYEVKDFNKQGLITKHTIDYSCMGYQSKLEIKYVYDTKLRLISTEILSNDALQEKTNYAYDIENRVVREMKIFADPYLEKKTLTKYYGPAGSEDSLVVTIQTDKDTAEFIEYKSYISGLLLATSIRKRGAEKASSGTLHDYYSNRLPKKYVFTDYTGESENTITLFSYNENGQLTETKDDIDNNRATFLYDPDNGLRLKTSFYNRFGSLDKEVFHQYKYFNK